MPSIARTAQDSCGVLGMSWKCYDYHLTTQRFFVFVSPSLPGLKSKHTVTGMRSLSKILWLVVGTWWFQPKSSHDWMMRIQKFRWKYYLFSVEFFSSSPWVKQLPKRLVKLYLNHQLFGGHHGTWWEAWQPQRPLHPSHQNSSQGLRATACKVILCVIAIETQF